MTRACVQVHEDGGLSAEPDGVHRPAARPERRLSRVVLIVAFGAPGLPQEGWREYYYSNMDEIADPSKAFARWCALRHRTAPAASPRARPRGTLLGPSSGAPVRRCARLRCAGSRVSSSNETMLCFRRRGYAVEAREPNVISSDSQELIRNLSRNFHIIGLTHSYVCMYY